MLREAGLRADSLDATVEPKRREAWIARRQDDLDVLVVQPELVKTGLDLYAFPTIVFYQVGYNLFTLRQAARRSWRIGQTEPVRVLYVAYRRTMQETALALMARKLEVATWVEGDLPEGLADYGQVQAGIRDELIQALREGRGAASAESAWASLRRREAAGAERLDRVRVKSLEPASRMSPCPGRRRLWRVDDPQLALF